MVVVLLSELPVLETGGAAVVKRERFSLATAISRGEEKGARVNLESSLPGGGGAGSAIVVDRVAQGRIDGAWCVA